MVPRFAAPLALFVFLVGCDVTEPVEPGPITPPEPEPEEVVGTERLRVTDMFVVGLGIEEEDDGSFTAFEADTVRAAFTFTVYGAVDTLATCPPTADRCVTEWIDYPIVSETSVRLDRDVQIGGVIYTAGTDLMDLFNILEKATLITPFEAIQPVFFVTLDNDGIVLDEGDYTLSMRWVTTDTAVFEDTATFYFAP